MRLSEYVVVLGKKLMSLSHCSSERLEPNFTIFVGSVAQIETETRSSIGYPIFSLSILRDPKVLQLHIWAPHDPHGVPLSYPEQLLLRPLVRLPTVLVGGLPEEIFLALLSPV